MQPGGRLTPEARKQMIITLIAGGIFIFALAFFTASQNFGLPENNPPAAQP